MEGRGACRPGAGAGRRPQGDGGVCSTLAGATSATLRPQLEMTKAAAASGPDQPSVGVAAECRDSTHALKRHVQKAA